MRIYNGLEKGQSREKEWRLLIGMQSDDLHRCEGHSEKLSEN